MRPLTMVFAGVAGAKDDGVQHKCQTDESGRLSEDRKNGRKRKGNSTRVAGMQGILLISTNGCKSLPSFASLRALAPWWEITDVTEGNGRELLF